jgi:hypothetical protein
VWVLVSPRSSNPTLFEPIKGTAAVKRIDPTTNQAIGKPLPLNDEQPIALAAGDGEAWVGDYVGGSLSRVAVVPCGTSSC